MTVLPKEFENDALAGVEYQRRWERLAYELSGSYAVPAQRADDFLAGRASGEGDERASQAVEIFARYHHLDIFPAIVADRRSTPAETHRLVEAATRAAHGSAADGVNLLIAPELAGTKEGLELVSAIRSGMNTMHKPLIVTVLGASRSVPRGLDDLTNVFVLSDERSPRFEVAEEPLRLVQPGA